MSFATAEKAVFSCAAFGWLKNCVGSLAIPCSACRPSIAGTSFTRLTGGPLISFWQRSWPTS